MTPAVSATVAVGLLVGGAVAAWFAYSTGYDAGAAAREADWLERSRRLQATLNKDLDDANARILDLQQAAGAAGVRLEAAVAEIRSRTDRVVREVRALAGRNDPALLRDAVRLLNDRAAADAAPGGDANRDPAAPAGADPAAAAAAPGPVPVATSRAAAAEWIARARAAHDECRATRSELADLAVRLRDELARCRAPTGE